MKPHTFRAFKNKISHKLWGVVHMPAKTAKKGDVLVSYLTGPFTLFPWQRFTDPHTNYWECAEIVRLLNERGYDVDVISSTNISFVPKKKYAAMIDINQNLERLHSLLPADCKKVMHVTASYGEYQNEAERLALNTLRVRRNISLEPKRKEIVSKNPAYADFLEGFGNRTVRATYARFNKDTFPIPISVAKEFAFPETKDFRAARKHFLWFGGGGAILKGLDLVVEAFASLPELTLHIVGPAAHEKNFAAAFSKELSLPNIKVYSRPKLSEDGSMLVDGKPFEEIADMCAALIYPSLSEGTSGAVVQAMHAGVIPLITPETGISEEAPVTIISAPTVGAIVEAVKKVSETGPEELQAQARSVWEYARTHHTQNTFSKAYADFIDHILHL